MGFKVHWGFLIGDYGQVRRMDPRGIGRVDTAETTLGRNGSFNFLPQSIPGYSIVYYILYYPGIYVASRTRHTTYYQMVIESILQNIGN